MVKSVHDDDVSLTEKIAKVNINAKLKEIVQVMEADVSTKVRDTKELESFRGQTTVSNDRLKGLGDGIDSLAANSNVAFVGGLNVSDYGAAAINHLVENEKPGIPRNPYQKFFYDDFDRLVDEIAQDEQLYLSEVFPRKQLQQAMDAANVQGVEVSRFENGREEGNVYIVKSPNGDSISFSVYEHRNSDKIIINGTQNWDGKTPPYIANDENAYFSAFPANQHQDAANTLAKFFQGVQNGTITSAESLKKH